MTNGLSSAICEGGIVGQRGRGGRRLRGLGRAEGKEVEGVGGRGSIDRSLLAEFTPSLDFKNLRRHGLANKWGYD